MANNSLAINEKYNLSPSFIAESWSQFIRNAGGSASSLIPHISMGKYVEVRDKKLAGDSLIIFRRTDFDNLNMLSSMASKVSRCLMQIDRVTTSFANSQNQSEIIQFIHEQARLGIEFTVVPSSSTASEYFSSYRVDDNEDFVMPKSRKEIEGK
jgi:hypothetical protein